MEYSCPKCGRAHPVDDLDSAACHPVLRRQTGRRRRLRVSGDGRTTSPIRRRYAHRDTVGRLKDNPAFDKPIDVTHLVRQLSVPSGVRHMGFNVRRTTTTRPQIIRRVSGQARYRRCRSRTLPLHRRRARRSYLRRTSVLRFSVDVNRVIGGLIGAAGTLLGGVARTRHAIRPARGGLRPQQSADESADTGVPRHRRSQARLKRAARLRRCCDLQRRRGCPSSSRSSTRQRRHRRHQARHDAR